MTTNTGGPAFPHTVEYKGADCGGVVPHGGMTLRDYFAAKAMQIMWDAYDKNYCGLNNQDAPNTQIIAESAYTLADAMLKARAQ